MNKHITEDKELPAACQQMIDVIVTDDRLHENDWLPERAHQSAGIDLRAMFTSDQSQSEGSLVVPPRTAVLVPTGLRVWIRDPNLVGLLFPRSGTGHKRGLVLGNGTGVIDADYQGPLMVSLLNRTDFAVQVELGERIAQLVVAPISRPGLNFVTEFNGDTTRGSGGFGSTGHK